MKITIEGEPKEIAALEQVLKDGYKIAPDKDIAAKAIQDSKAKKFIPEYGLGSDSDTACSCPN